MYANFEARIKDMIQNCTAAKVLDTDHTSVLFRATIKTRGKVYEPRGIFYPQEWQDMFPTELDDFELEDF